MALTYKDTKAQSKAVYAQFGEGLWKKNVEENAKIPANDAAELRNIGIGKTVVLVAAGPSLERDIETLKKYRSRVDIACCDKAFGILLDHGIKADYVSIADAGIPFRWIEKYIDQTEGVSLFAGCYCNPEWARAWKGKKYFYCNEDSIDTQKIFKPMIDKNGFDCRIIPAGSNVSNAMLCFINGSNNAGIQNYMGYDRVLLVGYDFSWSDEGNYYAFNNPIPKRYYMHHRTLLDYKGNMANTSDNLLFSAKWLHQYITAFGINAVNCSEAGLLDIPQRGPLEPELLKTPADKAQIEFVQNKFKELASANQKMQEAKAEFLMAQEALYGHR